MSYFIPIFNGKLLFYSRNKELFSEYLWGDQIWSGVIKSNIKPEWLYDKYGHARPY